MFWSAQTLFFKVSPTGNFEVFGFCSESEWTQISKSEKPFAKWNFCPPCSYTVMLLWWLQVTMVCDVTTMTAILHPDDVRSSSGIKVSPFVKYCHWISSPALSEHATVMTILEGVKGKSPKGSLPQFILPCNSSWSYLQHDNRYAVACQRILAGMGNLDVHYQSTGSWISRKRTGIRFWLRQGGDH